MDSLNTFRQRVLERENRLWDEANGYDTRGWLVPDDVSTASGVADGFPYAGTHVRLARALMRSLESRAAGATFVDLGSGKGRVPLIAAALPFAEVVGVEYARELHAVACRNADALVRSGDTAPVRFELADVRDFGFPTTALVIYLNNPFPEEVLTAVLAGLGQSYAAAPRPVTLVYQQLRREDAEHDTRNLELLDRIGFLTRRPLRFPGTLNRWLLRQYAVEAFVTAELLR